MAPARRAPRAKKVGSAQAERQQWAETYENSPFHTLPWFRAVPEPQIVLAEEQGRLGRGGRSLDVGCGAGTNVLWLAQHGFRSVGVDLAPGAVRAAETRRRRLPKAQAAAFAGGDALALPFRTGAFDFATDVGCFHSLPIPRRDDYAAELARVVRPGGRLFLGCFAREETRPMGPPHRPSILEVAGVFEREFIFERLTYVEASEGGPTFRAYELTLQRRTEPQPPPR